MDVLVVGAGPVGLTVAGELRQRGIDVRVVEQLAEPPRYAKAVGIQPRTLELWERAGVLRDALDAAIPMRGQLVYVNGHEVARMETTLPPEVPYGFLALPQYVTEELLTRLLQRLGGRVERGTELVGFEQDADTVTARLRGPAGEETVRASYLVGADGAHSIVRKGLGLDFAGDAFPEGYMLGDVEVDWDMPAGFGIRSLHRTDGQPDDILVCIPLPSVDASTSRRYRMSMLVPDELAIPPSADAVQHGFTAGPAPKLRHIQAVLDRLAPQPTKAHTLRWSSVFRISHRLTDRYGDGRVFVAGDAAHIHPPTGAQGMNTGIQDGINLAWKLALAVAGEAADGLLASYQTERHPIGEEVVGRTVRHAKDGMEADTDDLSTVILREAQLLVNYRGSSVVHDGGGVTTGPQPGERAPDCTGLRRAAMANPVRLFELLAGPDHTLLLYAEEPAQLAAFTELSAFAAQRCAGRLRSYVIASPATAGIELAVSALPVLLDAAGTFRAAYGATSGSGHLVRPDGYLGLRAAPMTEGNLRSYFDLIFSGRR